ncbi:hypothetical protein [Chitinasiproducens palmae]|uniref:Uncharacterized protein n=1 Tax=Chitinasiproducens palmae TaxID=1770053 RepID=A0A1H2PSC3_9BURK|nr:hypothetical protein [Chitinasiproducens palmae]SDV49827.1 hypothetical protein SAMN05216551_109172 [Chitinasiproducens palmae]
MSIIIQDVTQDINDSSVEPIAKDQFIRYNGVKSLFDFKSNQTYPQQAPVAASPTFYSLVDGGASMQANTAMTTSQTPETSTTASYSFSPTSKGLIFAGQYTRSSDNALVANGAALLLPDAFKKSADNREFMIGFMFKNRPVAVTGSLNAAIISYGNGSGMGSHQSRFYLPVTNGALGNFELGFNGVTANMGGYFPKDTKTVHQCVGHFRVNDDNASFTGNLFIDGDFASSFTGAYSGSLLVPGSGALARAGGSGFYNGGVSLELYRLWTADLAGVSRSAADIVAQEWALYKDRFN